MTTLSIPHRETFAENPPAWLLRSLRAHNPFYLLSALCMLAGCWLLAGSVTGAEHGARLARAWTLFGLLNIYEFMLVGLAVYLGRRRGLERDAKTLLVLEMLFLADATNLCAESWSLGQQAGLAMTAAALVLGAAKAAIVIRGLGLRPTQRALAGLVAAGVLLLWVPALLATLNRSGADMDLAIHGGWWLVSAAALATFFLMRGQGAGRTALEVSLGRAAGGILLGSLAVHALAASWVYAADFTLSHLAPLCVALTVISWRASPGSFLGPKGLAWLRAGLPVAAVVLGAASPEHLIVHFTGAAGLSFSPLRAVLLALSAACLWDFLTRRRWFRAAAALVLFLLACGGESLPAIVRTGLWLAGKVIPRTAGQWGAAALVAAFLLLAAGAGLSLRRKRPPEAEEESADA
ncbi:MAG TPA: hypothetical protein PK280_05415 [Planctomycetota bacterium]|nr:hypothetical protein [Planctomycetota bacterium]